MNFSIFLDGVSPSIDLSAPKLAEQNLKEQIMKETFKNTASNGYLNKDRFNEALSCLEKFNIKRLRDTPMAERLFMIFDDVKPWFFYLRIYK